MTEPFVKRLLPRIKQNISYITHGVWHDTRAKWSVNLVKTLNLSVRSFFNGDLQSQACAMTYRTLLALVPALALIFAIGRGFGLQSAIHEQLKLVFPAQTTAIDYCIEFVNKYLSQSTSGGLFVGIGIVFLLWTLISLMSNIEGSFNLIWGVKGRGFGRKITDYTAILLILPIMLICSSGLRLSVSSTLQSMFDYTFLSSFMGWFVEFMSWVATWIFFALTYYLIPNTKVKFRNAFVSGFIAGTAYMILQWVFISGQMYVANYNAIYGSVSFLPLLLIWMQLTYVITFAGAVVCYSSQSIFMFSFNDAINSMSPSYHNRLLIAISAVVVQRFIKNQGATTDQDLINGYNFPPRLVSLICDKLVSAGVFVVVDIDSQSELKGYQPAINPANITVAEVFRRVDKLGAADFITDFEENFPGINEKSKLIFESEVNVSQTILLSEIKIKS